MAGIITSVFLVLHTSGLSLIGTYRLSIFHSVGGEPSTVYSYYTSPLEHTLLIILFILALSVSVFHSYVCKIQVHIAFINVCL